MQQISHMDSLFVRTLACCLYLKALSSDSHTFYFVHLDCLVLQLDASRVINECYAAEFVISTTEFLACMISC